MHYNTVDNFFCRNDGQFIFDVEYAQKFGYLILSNMPLSVSFDRTI